MSIKQTDIKQKIDRAIKENLQAIQQEIMETKELMVLLNKARTDSLESYEKSKVKEQLFDILKTIPAVSIFLMPLGSIVLPLLIKYLPFDILPSAFDDKD